MGNEITADSKKYNYIPENTSRHFNVLSEASSSES
jgi:hypothetical protein